MRKARWQRARALAGTARRALSLVRHQTTTHASMNRAPGDSSRETGLPLVSDGAPSELGSGRKTLQAFQRVWRVGVVAMASGA